MSRVKMIGLLIMTVIWCQGSAYAISWSRPDIQFSVSGSESFEEDNAVHTFTVTKSGDASMAGTVDYTFGGNADYGSDYNNIGGTSGATALSGTVSFASGETEKTITITCIDDVLDEINLEMISVNLSNPTASGGSAGLKLLGITALKNITDNDPQPQVTLSVQGSPIAENGGVATVTATLSTVSGRNVVLTMSFFGTATAADYDVSSVMIMIPPGDTQGSITITGKDDADDDDDETIIVGIFLSIGADEVGQQLVQINFQNEKPTLTKIPDLYILEDQHSDKVPFQVDDEDDPAGSLRVFGWAENQTLVPDGSFIFYGDGNDRAFRVTPAPDQTGVTKAWIKVYDGVNWAHREFMITVSEKNDPPGPGQEPEPVEFNEDETDSLFLAPYVHDPDNDPSDLRWTVDVAADALPEGSEQSKGSHLQGLMALYKSYFVIFDETVPVNAVLKDTSQTDTWVIVPQEGSLTSMTEYDTLRIQYLEQVNGLYVSIVRATTETFFYGSPDFYDTQIPLLFTARDPWQASYSFIMIVTINPVNDAPVFLEPLPEVLFGADEIKQAEWGLTEYTEDIDNAVSSLSFQASGSEHIAVTLKSDTLVLTADPGWTGTEQVEVIVSDGDLADTAYCQVTVTAQGSSDRQEMATGIHAKSGIPDTYHLYDAYPNPFNPVTTIEYALPKSAHVRLSVYNMMGQCVQVLADEIQEPGFHAQVWNAQNLSSGLYLFKMQTPDYVSMRRCILVK
ncbi:T9SS type A sorting domain-containing protein [bacterium]|nr:T9SS type A sorting domain-containing protein [bacterium]